MPDISMCTSKECASSATCYRHADSGTKPDPLRQAYMLFGPQQCEAYMPVAKKKEPKK